MNDVFIVSEVWFAKNCTEDIKRFRKKLLQIYRELKIEIVFSNHPYKWINNPNNEMPPNGIEVLKIKDETTFDIFLKKTENLKNEFAHIFERTRMYLSKY